MTLAWTILGSLITFVVFILTIPAMGLAGAGLGMNRQLNDKNTVYLLPRYLWGATFWFTVSAPLWTIVLAWVFFFFDFSSAWYWWFLVPYPTYVIGWTIQSMELERK
ncbi:hypothetical protein [Litoribrevibacter albus]|uniref:Uncharacterized protein n=1 Tax=Litoribrevibacter albus TaxID=1473156 RepID=A0AA37SAW7_9GAMM|nr:hypothetical protein [Litoribrevibacter albus]GLQ31337.1 hypothetical protein GCM10007876_18160 [Litoribrevibacter albus]